MSGVSHRVVAAGGNDLRFDRWCRRHFPTLGHVQLQKLLRTGQFRLDGKRVEAGTRVQPGQTVRVPPMELATAPERRGPSEADARFIRSLVVPDDDEVVVLAGEARTRRSGAAPGRPGTSAACSLPWRARASGRSWSIASTGHERPARPRATPPWPRADARLPAASG
ncbi:MAG: hypothetical protein R3C69_16330 [Geminicoccaceae bacterium]